MEASERSAPSMGDGVIVLNGYTLSDVAAHLAGEDEETARRFGWYPHRSTEQTVRKAIEHWQEGWQRSGNVRAWAVRDARSGTLVGGCEVRLKSEGRAEMSYWTAHEQRGRGIASRAARLACDYAFRELGVERMEVYVEPDNLASRRTAERAGFVQEAVLRRWARVGDERRDMVLYSRLPADP